MELTFTKISAVEYNSRVLLTNGLQYEVRSYDKAAWLPHDLGHYVVESDLKLKQGFWGCVEAGAIVPSMRLVAGKLNPRAMEHSQKVLRQAGQRATEAEVWVGFFLYAAENKLDQSPNLFQSKLNNMWLSGKPERQIVPFAQARQLCQQLRYLSTEWQILEDGKSLNFKWAVR